jgi:hypothetical protein
LIFVLGGKGRIKARVLADLALLWVETSRFYYTSRRKNRFILADCFKTCGSLCNSCVQIVWLRATSKI